MSETGVAAVNRALSILNAMGPDGTPKTLNEIASATGMYKSTILRLIASLERFNCILRLADGRYQLGPSLFHWGSLYQRSLKLEDHVVPLLRQLVEATGESASFYTRQGDERLCLFRVDSPKSVRDHVRPGDLLPLGMGAAGRVLREFGTGHAERHRVRVIATQGERDRETGAVAAPVFGPQATLLGALSLSGPLMRFGEEAVARMTRPLLEAARQLTSRLGGDASCFDAAAAPEAARSRRSAQLRSRASATRR